ncbi:hypothetical protein [Streptomyces sp. NPDC048172]|uniref:hypothetical protein n=1 Tax=Streptomyces sp. NPDC048172 TaxID=3365505 RepID=UPI0037241850
MSDGTATGERPEARTPVGPSARSSRAVRLLRGRPGAALAGLLVGALVAAGLMAWRADALPFLPKDRCWGALSEDDVSGLFSDEGEIRAHELPFSHAVTSDDNGVTQCSLQRYEDDEMRWEVTAEVRDLGSYANEDLRQWPTEFLSSRMVPLGGGVTGMVSPSRAWVALPKSCSGDDDLGYQTPSVVSLSSGGPSARDNDPDEARTYRAALARAVVHLANGVMDRSGCEKSYPDPDTDALPALADSHRLDGKRAESLCGVRGLRLPERARPSKEYAYSERLAAGSTKDARICDVGQYLDQGDLRLMTLRNERLAHLYAQNLQQGSVPVTPVRKERKDKDRGTVAGDVAVYVARCGKGDVAFVAQGDTVARQRLAPDLLPAYVEKEAERIGCGELKVRVPSF